MRELVGGDGTLRSSSRVVAARVSTGAKIIRTVHLSPNFTA